MTHGVKKNTSPSFEVHNRRRTCRVNSIFIPLRFLGTIVSGFANGSGWMSRNLRDSTAYRTGGSNHSSLTIQEISTYLFMDRLSHFISLLILVNSR